MTHHHATVCIANTLEDSAVPKEYKVPTSDTTHIITLQCTIDDVRKLSVDAVQKPVIATHRVFVVVTQKLPVEAQNALLKLFEEPPAQTKFFLVVPQAGILLPTLRSRVQLIERKNDTVMDNEAFETFIKSSYAQRMETIVTITKKKDIATIEALFTGAEYFIDSHLPHHTSLLRSIIMIRTYAKTKGASSKMLLEELALTLPTA